MADVLLQGPMGAISVPEEEVGSYLSSGDYVPASSAAQAQRAQRMEYGGLGGAAIAAGTGALGSATLGLSDVAARGIDELAGTNLTGEISAYQEANPYATIGGQIGGALIGAGKFAGPGMALRGARAITAPARLAARAGMGVERALGGRLLGSVAGAGLEGAIQGAGMGISQLALSDDPVTGEKIAASLLHNAGQGVLFGSGAALGLGLAGKTLGAAGRGLKAAGRAGVETLDPVLSGLAGKPSGTFKGFLEAPEGFGGATRAEIAMSADDHLARLAKESGDNLAAHLNTRNATSYGVRGKGKEEVIARTVLRDNETAQVVLTYNAFSATRLELEKIADDLTHAKAARNRAKDALKNLDGHEARLQKAAHTGDTELIAKESFLAADDAYRDIGDLAKKVDASGGRAAQAGQGALIQARTHFRDLLENQEVWGEAAAFQRDMNKAADDYLVNELVELGFMKKVGKTYGQPVYEFDQAKWSTFVRNMDSPAKAEVFDKIERVLNNSAEYVDTASRYAKLSVKEQEAVKAMARQGQTVRDSLARAREVLQFKDDFNAFGSSANRAAMLNGVLGGGLIGGLPGAAVGLAVSAATNPKAWFRAAAAAKQLASNVDAGATRSVSRALRRAGTVPAIRDKVPAVLTPALANSEDKRQRYAIREQEIRAAALSPEVTKERVAASVSPIATAGLPTAAQSIADKYAEVTRFLMKKLPSEGAKDRPMSKSEVEKFLRVDEVATDPMALLKYLENGRISREQVETVKELWPNVFGEIQKTAMLHLADTESKGKKLKYQERLKLGLLLEIPTDPSLSAATMSILQGGYAQPGGGPMGEAPTPKRRGGRPSDLSEPFKTGSEALAEL